MFPKVSIILPTYNGAFYLKEAIDSVLMQTYKNFEIIAIDNGSCDDTLKVLNSYGERVRLLFEQRQGVAYARNKGIAQAQGEYVAFIDQDDIWLPHKLFEQVELIKGSNVIGMVSCGFYGTNENAEITRVVERKEKVDIHIKNELFIRNIIGPPSCMLIRKSVLDCVGGFDINLNGVEDKDLWVRILKDFDVRFVNKALIKYRFHRGNAHKNIPFMKTAQKRFICKHKNEMNFIVRLKAYSYIYEDAALEYRETGQALKSFVEIVKSMFFWPFPVYYKDEKYKYIFDIIIRLFSQRIVRC